MKIILTELAKCTGCHSCELACAIRWSKSGALADAIMESPRPASRVRVLGVGTQPVPLQCQQCEDAPCAMACPTKALYRPEPGRPVVFRRDICIGCSSCVLACPFGVLTRADGGVMAKCDLCWDRLAEGGHPACVDACHTRARKLIDANVVADDKALKTARLISSLDTPEGGDRRIHQTAPGIH